MKHHSLAVDSSNLNFENINSEILANPKEQEEATAGGSGGEDIIIVEGTDLGQRDETVALLT